MFAPIGFHMLTKMKRKKNRYNFNCQNFRNPKRTFVKTIEKIIEERGLNAFGSDL